MADKDPFAEFGGAEEPTEGADPFAEFGGTVETAEPVQPLTAGLGDAEPVTFDAPLPPSEQGKRTDATLGDKAQSFAEGAVEGGWFGMRTPLDYAKAAGGYIAAAIDPTREANFNEELEMARSNSDAVAKLAPGSHMAGELVGAVGTAMLPGASPVGSIAKGAAKLGEGVGASVAGYLAKGAAQGVARQGLFAKAAGAGFKLATEGAIVAGSMGAAEELDKAIAAGDFKSVGQKMAAAAVSEGITGAKFNVALGGTLGLVGKALKKAPSLADIASGMAFKGLGGKKKDIALAEYRVQGGGKAVGRTLMDLGIITKADPTIAGTLERNTVALEQTGRKLGELRKQVGDNGVIGNASGLAKAIRSEVLDPLLDNSATRKKGVQAANKLQDILEELEQNAPKPQQFDSLGMPVGRAAPPDVIDFDRLTKIRVGLDKVEANWNHLGDDKMELNAVREARKLINNYWHDAAEQVVAQSDNPELVTQIREEAQKFARLATAEKLLQESVARKGANRTIGMSDTQLGQAGVGMGAMIGSAVAPLTGTAIGGVVGGAVGAVGNKIVRERGNFFVSDVLNKVSKKAVKVQSKLQDASALRGLVSPKAVPAAQVSKGFGVPAFAGDVDAEIENAEQVLDPESDAAHDLGASLQHMEFEAGPELAREIEATAMARAQYIVDKAGPAPAPSPFGKSTQKREIDDDERALWERRLAALNDPTEALARVGAGEHTPEDMDVLQNVYGTMWEEFKSRAVNELAERGKALDYDQQVAVADALGLPLVPGTEGESMAFWQGVSALGQEQAAEKEAQKEMAAKAKISGGKGAESRADRATA